MLQDMEQVVLEYDRLLLYYGKFQPTGKCVRAIEGAIRQHPTQWFMFRQFWKEMFFRMLRLLK